MRRTTKNFINTTGRLFDYKQERYERYSGFLGLYSEDGVKIVDVPNRPGFVYVRLIRDLSSAIVAYNDSVLPVWGVAVEVERIQGVKGMVWRLLGTDPYSVSNVNVAPGVAFLPKHGDQHSFNMSTTGSTMGADPVWVYKDQFMPLNVTPDNPLSMKATVHADAYQFGNAFHYFGTTGTVDFTPLIPESASDARFITICLNTATNGLEYVTGSVVDVDTIITDPYTYMGVPTDDDVVPLKAVMVTGYTTQIRWENLFDVRTFYKTGAVGSGGGGGGGTLQTYFLTTKSSPPEAMRDLTTFPGNIIASTQFATLVSGSDVPLQDYKTLAGQPSVSLLPGGIWNAHVTLRRGVGAMVANVYWKLFKTTHPGGVETILATSAVSANLTDTNAEYDIPLSLSSTVVDPTDRIGVRFYANLVSGSPVTVYLTYMGGTYSRIESPVMSGNVGTLPLATNKIFIGDGNGVAAAQTMSGDATLVANGALTLANTGVTPGTYGNTGTTVMETVDSKGRITSAVSRLLTEYDLNLSDIIVNDATTGRHGFLKKGSGQVGQYLGGDLEWHNVLGGPPGGSNQQLQYNNTGTFGGVPLLYDKSTPYLTYLKSPTPGVVEPGHSIKIEAGGPGGYTPDAGDFEIVAGSTTGTGAAGEVTIRSGRGGLNGGGRIIYAPGGSDSSADGYVEILDPTSLKAVIFDTSVITDDRSYIFPNANGTLALTNYGTSFPGSPATGDQFFRTDLGWLCYYDGTRWLTVHEYEAILAATGKSSLGDAGYSVTSTVVVAPVRTDYAPYITRVVTEGAVNTTNDGTNNWTINVRGVNAAYAAASSIDSFTTAADTASVWVAHEHAPSVTATPSNRQFFDVVLTKNSSPGVLIISIAIYYRLIVT